VATTTTTTPTVTKTSFKFIAAAATTTTTTAVSCLPFTYPNQIAVIKPFLVGAVKKPEITLMNSAIGLLATTSKREIQ